jgi:hypothetical protein
LNFTGGTKSLLDESRLMGGDSVSISLGSSACVTTSRGKWPGVSSEIWWNHVILELLYLHKCKVDCLAISKQMFLHWVLVSASWSQLSLTCFISITERLASQTIWTLTSTCHHEILWT